MAEPGEHRIAERVDAAAIVEEVARGTAGRRARPTSQNGSRDSTSALEHLHPAAARRWCPTHRSAPGSSRRPTNSTSRPAPPSAVALGRMPQRLEIRRSAPEMKGSVAVVEHHAHDHGADAAGRSGRCRGWRAARGARSIRTASTSSMTSQLQPRGAEGRDRVLGQVEGERGSPAGRRPGTARPPR